MRKFELSGRGGRLLKRGAQQLDARGRRLRPLVLLCDDHRQAALVLQHALKFEQRLGLGHCHRIHRQLLRELAH